ncbi:hypothetical protein [Agarivorans sp. QJM3NY_25]|uniref:hypothetical protein n=1 Tax=Agarivorans sp. QJM3NY_25 TaxID=3421430 RepID=UPI003D7DCC51
MDLLQADSRGLSDPMAEMLENNGPEATFDWLIDILSQQRPALRSPNSKLLAYTGLSEALIWIENNIESPVTTHWGEGAALLGTPWGKIKEWLNSDKSKKIMALDTLYAYRLPAPNMAPFAQIAAPVLEDAPSIEEFEATLNTVLENGANPRMRQMVEAIMDRSLEILTPRERGVSVEDLPKLFLDPDLFQNSNEVLTRHEKVLSGIRESIKNIINGVKK